MCSSPHCTERRERRETAAGALTGRALVTVTLNSGAPAEARETAAWATGHGARFMAGAIKNVPSAVGAPGTLLYYGGDRTVFTEHETTLRTLGGDTVHLGEEPDLAALYEMAVGATLLPALVGFFQCAAAVQARGLAASTLVPFAVKWLEMIGSILSTFAREIDTGDYTDAQSSGVSSSLPLPGTSSSAGRRTSTCRGPRRCTSSSGAPPTPGTPTTASRPSPRCSACRRP